MRSFWPCARVGSSISANSPETPYTGIPAFRRNNPSVAPALIVGITGMPGHISSVTDSIAPSISGVNGEDGDSIYFIKGWAVELWTDFSIVEFEDIGEEGVVTLVNSGSWMGKAGGYDIAGEAADFVTLIEGRDEAVLGFSPRAIHRLVDLIG